MLSKTQDLTDLRKVNAKIIFQQIRISRQKNIQQVKVFALNMGLNDYFYFVQELCLDFYFIKKKKYCDYSSRKMLKYNFFIS